MCFSEVWTQGYIHEYIADVRILLPSDWDEICTCMLTITESQGFIRQLFHSPLDPAFNTKHTKASD